MNEFNFKIIKPHKQSRLGKLSTAHGEIDTPVFMPVGTAATVKAFSNYFSKYLSPNATTRRRSH